MINMINKIRSRILITQFQKKKKMFYLTQIKTIIQLYILMRKNI